MARLSRTDRKKPRLESGDVEAAYRSRQCLDDGLKFYFYFV